MGQTEHKKYASGSVYIAFVALVHPWRFSTLFAAAHGFEVCMLFRAVAALMPQGCLCDWRCETYSGEELLSDLRALHMAAEFRELHSEHEALHAALDTCSVVQREPTSTARGAAERADGCRRACYNLGALYLESGRMDKSKRVLEEALGGELAAQAACALDLYYDASATRRRPGSITSRLWRRASRLQHSTSVKPGASCSVARIWKPACCAEAPGVSRSAACASR